MPRKAADTHPVPQQAHPGLRDWREEKEVVEKPKPQRAGSEQQRQPDRAELEPSGSWPKPVGIFAGGRGNEKQYDFMLIVQSLSRTTKKSFPC